MRRVIALALVLLGACSAASPNNPSTPSTAVPRVLYLTHSAGFKHDVLPLSQQIMRDAVARTGAFDVTASTDCALISPEALRGWDAVVFYTTGELPVDDASKRALLEFVRSGKGFVGIHSATDTFYQWPDYGEMIGGYFDGHPWHQEVRINVEGPSHPATAHLPPRFSINDEIYQFRNWSRNQVRLLLSLDNASVDVTKPGVNRADRDFALAWTREYGRGRVFYTGLGHEPDVWRDPRYQQHLASGIGWAIGPR